MYTLIPAPDADWARSGGHSGPQDEIKEILNCILAPSWPLGAETLLPKRGECLSLAESRNQIDIIGR